MRGIDFYVPDSHKKELDGRYQKYLENPEKLLSLEELQARINQHLCRF